MGKRIIYTRPLDLGLVVVSPNPSGRLVAALGKETFDPPIPAYEFWREGPQPKGIKWAETEAEWLDRVIARSVPTDASDIEICDETDLPADREFRNAWVKNGRGAAVDMPKARGLHMARIREARNRELERLDGEQARALGRGDAAAVEMTETVKQALRDLPAKIDLDQHSTPEDLSAFWPAQLPGA